MTLEYDNQEYFFASRGDYHVDLSGYGYTYSITVEEMYRHFEARILNKLASPIITPPKEGTDHVKYL